MTATRLRVTKGVVALVTIAFLALLAGSLAHLGFAGDRVALFALLGAVGLVGPIGVFAERPYVAAGGACGLLLIGFTQPVLWMALFPLAGILVVAALVLASHEEPADDSTLSDGPPPATEA